MSVILVDWLLVPGEHNRLVRGLVSFLVAFRKPWKNKSHQVNPIIAAHVVSTHSLELVIEAYCIKNIKFNAEGFEFRDCSAVESFEGRSSTDHNVASMKNTYWASVL